MKVLSTVDYDGVIYEGVSVFSGERVQVFGEQLIELEDGTRVNVYLYHIVGFTPENNKPFVSIKENILL